jgi:hypothetical protein
MMNRILHPIQYRRLKKAQEAHRFTPTADDLARWAAEDQIFYEFQAERWVDAQLS